MLGLTLDEREAQDLLEALDTYLEEETMVLARTDVHALQRELHQKLDRIEAVRNRLRAVLESSAGLQPDG